MSAGVPEIRTEMNIMKEAMMFTIDSRASDNRATDPEMKNAANLRQNTTKPPITAIVADWFLLTLLHLTVA